MAVKEVLQPLVDLGLLDVILPFLLIFTITFGILQRTKLFGTEEEQNTRFNAMIAFVMGFFGVLATNLLNVINIIIAYGVLLLLIGLMLSLVLGLAGAEINSKNKILTASMGTIVFLLIFYGLAQTGIINMQRFWSTLFLPVVLLLLLAWIIYFVAKTPKKRQHRPAQQETQQTGQIPPQ